MHWRWVPAWVFALAATAQTVGLTPELLTLARIKTAMSQTLGKQPNYTCVQQIERSHRRIPKRKFELHDLLRLEVALVDGKEMFAWPGAGKFEEADLTKMVLGGAIGTGDFAMHARAVFQTSAPRFRYAGESELRGHKATRYDFVVPLLASGYRLKAGEREATVGYHGSLWADESTHELLSLEVNADDIPPELGITSAQDVMDYGRVRIGSSDFLLPVGSELSLVDLNGNESRNRTQFKSCRQYTGESVLTFAEAPSDEGDLDTVSATTESARKQSPAIPADMLLEIRLTTDVDSASSAVGDPVSATLDRNLKSNRSLLFAKGATLLGRILRLERNGDFTTLDIQFSTIESDAGRSTLLARIDSMTAVFANHPGRSLFNAPESDLSPQGGLRIRGNRIHLRPGSQLRLRTVAVASRQ